MTEEFKLREQWTRLVICGAEYKIEVCEETAKLCGEILAEARTELKKIKSIKSEIANDTDVCAFLKRSIDRLLGFGSVDKIFVGRKQELCDLAELMCYVVSQIRCEFLRRREALTA